MEDSDIDVGIVITLVPADNSGGRLAVFYSIRTASEFLARDRWRDWTSKMEDASRSSSLKPEKAPLEAIERQLRECWLKASSGG
jgi:hypothetical protein